jgi:hypothetical protein
VFSGDFLANLPAVDLKFAEEAAHKIPQRRVPADCRL